MISVMHRYMGTPKKPIITIPTWLFAAGAKQIEAKQRSAGTEGGLLMEKFVYLQTKDQFIDRSEACVPLGVTDDDIESAIGESVTLSMEVIEQKAKVIDMKGE
jgi:hypothetical protein